MLLDEVVDVTLHEVEVLATVTKLVHWLVLHGLSSPAKIHMRVVDLLVRFFSTVKIVCNLADLGSELLLKLSVQIFRRFLELFLHLGFLL